MENNGAKTDEKGNNEYYERMDATIKASGAADKSFFLAAKSARQSVERNGLLPHLDEWGGYKYTVKQGIKAACHAREDVVATLLLQRDILLRLDRNYRILWMAVGLLFYVSIRVS